MLFRQFRGLGTVADGGLQALGIHGTSHLRGERRRAPKIARLRNTPPTAVQHDEMSGRPTFLPTGSPCASRERRCYTSLPLLSAYRNPQRAICLSAAIRRLLGPLDAGRGEPGLGLELAGNEDCAQRDTAVQ